MRTEPEITQLFSEAEQEMPNLKILTNLARQMLDKFDLLVEKNKDDKNIFDILIEREFDNIAIDLAIDLSNFEAIEYVFANLDTEYQSELIAFYNDNHDVNPLLHEASSADHPNRDIMLFWIDQGLDYFVRNENGQDIFDILIEREFYNIAIDLAIDLRNREAIESVFIKLDDGYKGDFIKHHKITPKGNAMFFEAYQDDPQPDIILFWINQGLDPFLHNEDGKDIFDILISETNTTFVIQNFVKKINNPDIIEKFFNKENLVLSQNEGLTDLPQTEEKILNTIKRIGEKLTMQLEDLGSSDAYKSYLKKSTTQSIIKMRESITNIQTPEASTSSREASKLDSGGLQR